ncbi:MAG TPA: RsmB/NOP family class I SAM-dependent RNA methyltransferase [bacterium]|nr:RsmB/NOP family class I SAM-dependent RNA methyltransferase [bacterium]
MSVEILSDGQIDETPDLLILDMAASPGGKTTQLAEVYPNSLVIGNEFDKSRLPQLLENIERMGSDNIAVTNYSGAFFSGAGEIFDRILLDAPCSGEGIAHKAPESLDYWNIKNVRKIAAVQTRLLRAALDTLAVGGNMVYSTCTLNAMENEGVVESAIAGRMDAFRITYDHRFWPHREETGGFYICRIEKMASTRDSSKDAPR